MKRAAGLAGLLGPLLLSAPVWAAAQYDVQVYPGSNQANWLNAGEYRSLMLELGLMISSKTLAPSNTLGANGFDYGVELTSAFPHGGQSYWQKGTKDNNMPSVYGFPTLRVRKGLPFSVEGGMTVSYLPFTSQQVLGGQLRVAAHEGYELVPDVALTLSYDKYVGNDQLDMNVKQAVATIGYTWPVGKVPGIHTGRLSLWLGYGKGLIDSQIITSSLASSDVIPFEAATNTGPSGFLEQRYDKWLAGAQLESGHFVFLLDGEAVDGGIPTASIRWGATF